MTTDTDEAAQGEDVANANNGSMQPEPGSASGVLEGATQSEQANTTQQANQPQDPDAQQQPMTDAERARRAEIVEDMTLADRLEAFRSNLIHDDAELEAQSFGTLLEMIQARRLPFHGGQADALELLKATRTEEARRAEDGKLPGSREVAGRAEPFQTPEAQPDTNATAAAVAEDIVAGGEVAKPEAPQPAAGENAGKVWNVHQQAWV